MNFVLKPSLEHMALIKIVVLLWTQNDVKSLISKLFSSNLYSSKNWKTVEERVIKKVPHLLIPQQLKEKMLGYIKPIGLQISEWMIFHCTGFLLRVNVPAEFCWTPQGTVDRKRTAEVLVRDESLDMSTRYKLACIYCMEDDIIQFWNSMPEDLIESVSHTFSIIVFWSRSRRRRGSHFDYRSEFHHSAVRGNKVAVDYFLQKLTPTERDKSLVETAKCVGDADTLCFFISEMNEKQQIQFFRCKPSKVLQCFLKWPRQSFFIEKASCMWDFLSRYDYDITLRNIVKKIDDGYKDWNYQNLFTEFWQKSPSALKSLITNEIHTSWLLTFLFRIKDKENIRLILKDTNLTAKEKLIYSDDMNSFCRRSILENKWDFLEFCIRECFPSENEMLKFKEQFEKHMCPFFKEHYFSTIIPKWHLLFCFFDDSICKCYKRSLEEVESSSSKQFRRLQ